MAKPRLHAAYSLVGVVLLALVAAASLVLWTQRVSAANEGAQALIDQALALWQQSKTVPGPDLTAADLEAKALLERVVAEYPGTEEAADALRHLAYGLYYKGHKDEAMAFYSRLFTEYPTARARFRAYADRAWFFAQEGKLQEALEDTKGELAAALTPEEQAEAKDDMGNAYYWMQKHAEALPWFERVMREHPDYPKVGLARLRAAACKQYLKDYAGAVALYEEAAAKETNVGQKGTMLLAAADAWREGGYHDKALIGLEKIEADAALVQAMQDGKAALLLVRGKTLLTQGKAEQGLETLRTAVALAPASVSAGKAALEMADWYAGRGDQQKALEEYSAVGQNQAANAWYRAMSYIKAGRIYRTLKQFEAALAAYDKAAEVAPADSNLGQRATIDANITREEMKGEERLKQLSQAEMDNTKGSWWGNNDKKCTTFSGGCPSACIFDSCNPSTGRCLWHMAVGIDYGYCENLLLFNCEENTYQRCAEWYNYWSYGQVPCQMQIVPWYDKICTWGCATYTAC